MSRRLLSAVALIAASMLVLTGCAPHVDADELPTYSIIQEPRGPFDGWSFSYLDSVGERQPISCPVVAIFQRRHCESADGIVSFTFSVRKSRVRLGSITVDGVERSMTKVDTELPDARRVWVPSDSLQTAP